MFGKFRQRLFRRSGRQLVFETRSGTQIALRGLTRRDVGQYRDHLRRLPPEDRHARFQAVVNDGTLDAHADRLDWEHALVFGVFADGVLRGVGELLPDSGGAQAEFAISVEPEFQHASIGRLLVAASLVAGRLARLTVIHLSFRRDNTGIRALARGVGAELHGSDGIVEGALHL
ncbi:GNAT family N-acetyltransferase [Tropicimonas sp. IMCC6043]|uniref:GNAT family N-acetyltransferase n=1 Tax=Tropicimonas sp. IMCC6043 TaxID=2510645 RepID=UPI00101D5FC7|nr:GNAT family N-acetyltransferase [Tropicimonas sp. IMCC6043]RYH08097.1 GNAT family N-acetyltransferase [Tropicimonas sp. IMCC6043]